MRFDYEEFDLSGVRTYPLKSRPSKARAEDFAKPYQAGSGVPGLLDSLPSVLGGAGFQGRGDGHGGGPPCRPGHRVGDRRARDQDRVCRRC